jgi:hypothetical protein
MIKFVVYETKIKDNKLTFEFYGSYDEYYEAEVAIAESNIDPSSMTIMPYDDDDEE